MKKFVKRLLAGVTALVMAATCTGATATTAFAATSDKESTHKASFTVSYKSTERDGTVVMPVTFRYAMRLESITNAGVGVSEDSVPYASLETNEAAFTKSGTQSITVDIPTYYNVGVYTYRIDQIANYGTETMYVDDAPLYMIVTAAYDEETHDLVNYVAFRKGSATGTKLSEKEVAFENVYRFSGMSVTKRVTGALGDRQRAYNIAIEFGPTSGVDVTEFVRMNTDELGRDAIVSSNSNRIVFKLHDGETINFDYLPLGTKYKVLEEETGNFTVNYQNDEGTIEDEDTRIVCTVENSFPDSVDTGISLDNMPYLLILAGVVVVGAGYIVSRKKRDEE